MKRILLVKTTSMGDVIHALPVLHDLTEHFPGVQVDWMVEAPFADLVRANARVSQVIEVNLRVWRKLGLGEVIRQWKLLKAKLAGQPYDAVIDLQGLFKSAVLACAAPGPRMGAGFGHVREKLAALFYRKRAGWDDNAHAVERLRQLVAGLMGYRLSGPPVFYDRVPGKRVPAIAHGATLWFLHATARDEKKWSVTAWRELAHRFSDLGYRIELPWGSEAERLQAQTIAQGIDHVEVLPKLSLAQVDERLNNVSLVIGVDTGLMHLAAAHYLPMVALFFATPAWRFAPRFNPHAISLGDVGHVPAAGEVFEAASRLIRGNKL
ncbi:MAG: lipopolysaccharide heptosyltransferase I [Limnobacter sp.]|uniref:lipopolysaccharide heptosyltransferase I n=1 Tax=Limnobacter sp. TaxID=2003368 RepID=UPI00391B9D41